MENNELLDLLRQIKKIAYNTNLASYDARHQIVELLKNIEKERSRII